MDLLRAAAIVTLWRSGRFDTADIAHVLGVGVIEADVVKVLDLVRARERGPDLRVVRMEAAE